MGKLPKNPDIVTKLSQLCDELDRYTLKIQEEKNKVHQCTVAINKRNKAYSKRIIKIDPVSRASAENEKDKDVAELRKEKYDCKCRIKDLQKEQKNVKKMIDQIQLAAIHEAQNKEGGQFTEGSLPENSLSKYQRFRLFNRFFGPFRDKYNFAGLLASRKETILKRLTVNDDRYHEGMPESRLGQLKATIYEEALTVAQQECGLRPHRKGDRLLARMLVELAENDLEQGETERYKKPKGEKPKVPELEGDEPEI